MRLHTLSIRQLTGMAAIACAAALIPAAALAATGTPTAPATPAHQTAAAVPHCTAGTLGHQLTFMWLAGHGDGYAGGVVYPLEFSNVSPHVCTLQRPPRVVAIGGNGQQVGLASGGGTAGRLITLRPGATAHVALNVLAPANCEHPVNATLYVSLPGQAQRQPTDITQEFCPNTAPVVVDSVHPLAAVPFHTIH
jgi:hypothetical protein